MRQKRDPPVGGTGRRTDELRGGGIERLGADDFRIRVERNELHLVDARIEARDRRSDIEEEVVPLASGGDRDRGQGGHVRVVLVGALGGEPVEHGALLLQPGDQRLTLEGRERSGRNEEQQAANGGQPERAFEKRAGAHHRGIVAVCARNGNCGAPDI